MEVFREKCEDHGVSPVIGVILLVAIVVILAAIVGILALGFGDDLTDFSTAAVDVENGEARLIDMGTSQKIIVKNNGSIESNLTKTGETTQVQPGDTIISISKDGSKNVIKSITKENAGSYTQLDVRQNTDEGETLDPSLGDTFNVTKWEIKNTGKTNVTVDVYLTDITGSTILTYDTDKTIEPGEVYYPVNPSFLPLEIELTDVDFNNSTAEFTGGSPRTYNLNSQNNTASRLVAEGEDSNGNSIKFTNQIKTKIKP